MSLAYYNENDPGAVEWLGNLIAAGLIAPGHIDSRSIKEVQPDDLRGYAQHHFFAGIGGWSAAARLAGWPDDRPLWTASCPCQPFSAAGKGLGVDDPRHLWPDLFRLWRAIRPACGVGEQVAGQAGYGWFDGVRTDLEGEGYSARAVDIPALAIDSPHERNRLYWVAVANSDSGGRGGRQEDAEWHEGQRAAPERLDDRANSDALRRIQPKGSVGEFGGRAGYGHNRGTFWSGADWIICHDEKARRVADARASMLVNGVRGRVAIPRPRELCPSTHPEEERWVSRIAAWKGFGNAIVHQLAAEVIAALAETMAIQTQGPNEMTPMICNGEQLSLFPRAARDAV